MFPRDDEATLGIVVEIGVVFGDEGNREFRAVTSRMNGFAIRRHRAAALMFAKMGVLEAINPNVERVFKPERQDHHRGRRKLARVSRG
jgi:hypothetical protein